MARPSTSGLESPPVFGPTEQGTGSLNVYGLFHAADIHRGGRSYWRRAPVLATTKA